MLISPPLSLTFSLLSLSFPLCFFGTMGLFSIPSVWSGHERRFPSTLSHSFPSLSFIPFIYLFIYFLAMGLWVSIMRLWVSVIASHSERESNGIWEGALKLYVQCYNIMFKRLFCTCNTERLNAPQLHYITSSCYMEMMFS